MLKERKEPHRYPQPETGFGKMQQGTPEWISYSEIVRSKVKKRRKAPPYQMTAREQALPVESQ